MLLNFKGDSMKILCNLILALLLVTCASKKSEPIMPLGEYRFQYVRGYYFMDTDEKTWVRAHEMEKNYSVYTQVKNDSLILLCSPNRNKNLIYTCKRISQDKNLEARRKLPANYLDFALVGVYEDDILPEFYDVFYYSPKREALMLQRQSDIGVIDQVVILMNAKDTSNPFHNVVQDFNMPRKTRSYNIKVSPGNQANK